MHNGAALATIRKCTGFSPPSYVSYNARTCLGACGSASKDLLPFLSGSTPMAFRTFAVSFSLPSASPSASRKALSAISASPSLLRPMARFSRTLALSFSSSTSAMMSSPEVNQSSANSLCPALSALPANAANNLASSTGESSSVRPIAIISSSSRVLDWAARYFRPSSLSSPGSSIVLSKALSSTDRST